MCQLILQTGIRQAFTDCLSYIVGLDQVGNHNRYQYWDPEDTNTLQSSYECLLDNSLALQPTCLWSRLKYIRTYMKFSELGLDKMAQSKVWVSVCLPNVLFTPANI